MSLNQKRWLVSVIPLMGVLLAVAGVKIDKLALVLFGLALLFAGIPVNFLLLRCPNCGSWLDRNHGDYCQYCGAKIPWHEKKS
jgi:hypothetical protein